MASTHFVLTKKFSREWKGGRNRNEIKRHNNGCGCESAIHFWPRQYTKKLQIFPMKTQVSKARGKLEKCVRFSECSYNYLDFLYFLSIARQWLACLYMSKWMYPHFISNFPIFVLLYSFFCFGVFFCARFCLTFYKHILSNRKRSINIYKLHFSFYVQCACVVLFVCDGP